MKKVVILVLIAILTMQCQNIKFKMEIIMDNQVITETVNDLFISVDNKDWENVKSIFSDKVLLDYTSMTGGQPAILTSSQIIDSWKSILPGFDKTHHQLGNYVFKKDSDLVKVFCYGTATHYLANESNNNIWTVVGSYDLELKMINNSWRIVKMKFNLKYTDGNNNLSKIAQERMKKIGNA
jgi:hypothetical protein